LIVYSVLMPAGKMHFAMELLLFQTQKLGFNKRLSEGYRMLVACVFRTWMAAVKPPGIGLWRPVQRSPLLPLYLRFCGNHNQEINYTMFSPSEMYALLQVLMADLALAGDNAIVVGLVAASVPRHSRKKVIIMGIVLAAVLRIIFSFGAVELLQVIGLMLAGGLLLLWVGWKLWREIIYLNEEPEQETLSNSADTPSKTFGAAVSQIVVADLSMSLDNVLAVAGAARHHLWVLVVGLALSVALMGLASTLIADLLKRYHWIAYIGIVVIFYIAGTMIWEGAHQVYAHVI